VRSRDRFVSKSGMCEFCFVEFIMQQENYIRPIKFPSAIF